MKIVIDTNVIASAIFFGGKPRELIEHLIQHQLQAFVTTEILEEYAETIDYLKAKYSQKPVHIPLAQIVSVCELINSTSDIKICRDPDDDKFINCAIDSKSLYVVSGDKDLLTLKKHKNIEIITVGDFLERFNK